MREPLVLLAAPPPKSLKTIWPQLVNELEARLRGLPTLGAVTGQEELKSRWQKTPQSRRIFRKYLSTLSLTGISDKELAWKLEKTLRSPNFLLLNFVSYPCTKDCSSGEQWVIRLKLIEARNGELIYQVRLSHQLEEEESSAAAGRSTAAYNESAARLLSTAMDEFEAGFIVPWHRRRYEYLKPETVRTPGNRPGI